MKEKVSTDRFDRFEKLRSMREQLWEKEMIRAENLNKQKWLFDQIKELKNIANCENCTLDIIKNKINQIVFEFEIAGDKK